MYVRIAHSSMFVLKPLLTILLFQTGLECMIRKRKKRNKDVPGCENEQVTGTNMCHKPELQPELQPELGLGECELDCQVNLDCKVSECDIRSDCPLKYVRLEAAAHYSIASDRPRVYDSEKKKEK
jgi:hypothetical protein